MVRYLKVAMAAFVLYLAMLAQSAVAQQVTLPPQLDIQTWEGSWNASGNPILLKQEGRRVYGDFSGVGYMEGISTADGRYLRGTFQSVSSATFRGYFAFERSGPDQFQGLYSLLTEGLPTEASNKVTANRTSADPGELQFAKGMDSYYTDRWQEEGRTPEEESWMAFGDLNAARIGRQLARARDAAAAAAAQAAAEREAAIDALYGRKYTFTNQGIDYGPFGEGDALELHLSKPDADRYVVAATPGGQDGLVFLGRMSENNVNRVRGVWMEVETGNITGRWGMMMLQAAGTGKMNGQWTAGKRNPRGNVDGHPGGPLSTADAATTGYNDQGVSVGGARALLTQLSNRTSDFPFIAKGYPDAGDVADMETWMDTNRGLCATGCAEREPAWVNVDRMWLGFRSDERRPEVYGTIGVRLVELDENEDIMAVHSGYSLVMDRERDEALSLTAGERIGPLEVVLPRYFGGYGRCATSLEEKDHEEVPVGSGQAIPIPPGLWTDPTRDIAFEKRISLSETGLRKRGDETYKVTTFAPLKSDLQGTYQWFFDNNSYTTLSEAVSAALGMDDNQFCVHEYSRADADTVAFRDVIVSMNVVVGRYN